jgi:hypothetical protein
MAIMKRAAVEPSVWHLSGQHPVNDSGENVVFERDFLSDVLRMLGEWISKLHNHVDNF